MYGIEDFEVSKLRRREMAREVRTNRLSGESRTERGPFVEGTSTVIRELGRDLGRLFRLVAVAKNAG